MRRAGGGALGSAAIYDEMMRYREQGKPMVVTMENLLPAEISHSSSERSLLLSLSELEVLGKEEPTNRATRLLTLVASGLDGVF